MALSPGTRLGPYEIVALLGAGGMGEVYRARDTRLGRDVAIKVLPQDVTVTPESRARFAREAKAISTLNHPNICVLHDIGREGEIDFLVMELVEGQTLADPIAAGPLPEREVVRLGEQLAAGLAAAHRAHVLHLDVKPLNLRTTPDGHLKILDFGLARLIRAESGDRTETVTQMGAVSGTVPYMSPEQLSGEHLDERTDVWAAGVVLYELATGRKPFAQESQARLIAAILNEAPAGPRERNAAVSPEFERIVLKCLAKDRTERYQSARDLEEDLRRSFQSPAAHASPAADRRSPWRILQPQPAVWLAALALLLVGSFFLVRTMGWFGGARAEEGPSLAVLPLANLSGASEQEYFVDGMTDELINRLSQLKEMRVISQTSSMQYKGTRKSLGQIARELGVRLVLEGSVLRAGDAVRISAQLIEARNERSLWADSYEKPTRDVLAIQRDVAQAIVQRIQLRVAPDERGRLETAPAVDPSAHEAYLRGRHEYGADTYPALQSAIGQFNKAVAIDSNYAAPYAGLADAWCAVSSVYVPSSEAMPRARAAAERALAIDPNQAGALASLAYVRTFYEWKWDEGERLFRRAIELNPGEATAHQFLGQLLILKGRTEEALSEIREARKIDPLSSYASAMTTWPLYYSRRFEETRRAARQLLGADPSNASLHYMLGMSLYFTGSPADAVAEVERAHTIDSRALYAASLAWLYARTERKAMAFAILDTLRTEALRTGVGAYGPAAIYAGLGERDSVFTWIDRAIAARSEDLGLLAKDPLFEPVFDDPRYREALRKLGLSG